MGQSLSFTVRWAGDTQQAKGRRRVIDIVPTLPNIVAHGSRR